MGFTMTKNARVGVLALCAAVLYCWQVSAHKASDSTDFVELENTGSVPIAIVSVTAECAR